MAADWETPAAAPANTGDGWGAAAPADNSEQEANTDASAAWGSGGDESTEQTEHTTEQHITKKLDNLQLTAKARDAGWTEKTAFDYDEYKRTGGDSRDWAGAAPVYEWHGEYGDVAPRVPELEGLLFGGEFQQRKGEHTQALEIEVNQEGPKRIQPIATFEEAGLHPVMLENIRLARYDKPTVIQRYTIPAVLQGTDVVAVAQTGSGKTAAYLIPVISRLMGKAKKLCAPKPNVLDPAYNPRLHKVRAEPLVVIVVPTRELAIQIFDEARRMCYRSKLRPCVAYGGLPPQTALEELGKGCDILIATPGRLCDYMDRPDVLTMSRVKYTIIDEADEMLHQDWEEQLKKIMAGGDTNEDADHCYLMFSATFPKAGRALAREYLETGHHRIRVGRAGSSHKNINQQIIFAEQGRKNEAVYDLLFASEPARTLIFCNSKASVDLLDDFLYNKGLPTTSIHADRNQREREDALRAFRTGRAPILIATGVSARGWDIKDVKHVINYDLPSGMYGGINEYIHRIGRTARIGHKGLATSFYNERNEDIAEELVKVLVEMGCEVPEFLAHLKPESETIDFDDDSDDEGESEGLGGGEATEGTDAGGFAPSAGSGWGAPAAAADTGFQATAGVDVGGW
ncbi:DEAD-domain-containing protein [Teratosphaeria nubilosa]|uniref:RNA helicase n=1 Tax=Teratosphaeria nubilosa TaxID=161662 RepID=A0A6G1LLQ0_9PEZI|nr:DEAD-domain-containing protein [Teratosphaeria nubilosa]